MGWGCGVEGAWLDNCRRHRRRVRGCAAPPPTLLPGCLPRACLPPPQAGQDVTVYYNPNNGGLPGRQHIWIK